MWASVTNVHFQPRRYLVIHAACCWFRHKIQCIWCWRFTWGDHLCIFYTVILVFQFVWRFIKKPMQQKSVTPFISAIVVGVLLFIFADLIWPLSTPRPRTPLRVRRAYASSWQVSTQGYRTVRTYGLLCSISRKQLKSRQVKTTIRR